MMGIALFLLILSWSFKSYSAVGSCEDAMDECQRGNVPWIRCYENRIMTCRTKGRFSPNFIRQMMSSSREAEVLLPHHRVQLPPAFLEGSREAGRDVYLLVTTVINSTFFKLGPDQPPHMQGSVLGALVLAVRAFHSLPDQTLSRPVTLIFTYQQEGGSGTCVFWQESLEDGTGHWGTDGCLTNNTGNEYICSCRRLGFFAVLVNPALSVEESNAVSLNFITYTGSALSFFFTVLSLIIVTCLQMQQPEKALGVRVQLTAALLCLHLSLLLCSRWVWLLDADGEGYACRVLGLSLHWSLLASFTWTALEGFHLLLVFRVRRYLLTLSLVGWVEGENVKKWSRSCAIRTHVSIRAPRTLWVKVPSQDWWDWWAGKTKIPCLPTLTAVVCGISGVYGKYTPELKDDDNSHNSTAQMCWMSSRFPQRLLVTYITTVAFPCLVILANSCMLGLVLFKLWGLRRGSGSSSGWKKMSRLWKDCVTVLGLSCVLGLPWGLMSTTYVSTPGIYVFTILNALQGVFMFLWSLALVCKSPSDNNSSVRDSSSQKMMTTSFTH